MRLDDLELLGLELAGLEQDGVRDRDLAEVVQRRGLAHEADTRSPAPGWRASRAASAPTRWVCSRRVVVAVLRGEREPAERVQRAIVSASRSAAERLRWRRSPPARPGARAARGARAAAEPAHAPRRRPPAAASSCDRHHGRRRRRGRAGPGARARPPDRRRRAPAIGLRLGGRGLRAPTRSTAGDQIDRRAARGGELCAQRDSAASRFPPITRTRVPARASSSILDT